MSGPLFLREFLRRPLEVASLVPSSPWLQRRIAAAANLASAETVVELGPGTGGTTSALLAAMAPHARLLAIEINEPFHRAVQRIADRRLIAHHGSAADLAAALDTHGLGAPDAIVSGIPFSRLSEADGTAVVHAVAEALTPGGRFVAYQVSDRVATLTRPVLGAGERSIEWLSIPPLRVFTWRKPTA